jgi:hypothetical protein
MWVEEGRRLDRINIGIDLTRINFRGRNERVNMIVKIGYNKYFHLGYRIPYIDRKMRLGMYADMAYATGRETYYTTDSNKLLFFNSEHYPYSRFYARLGTTYRNAYASSHDLSVSYHRYKISDAIFDQNPNYLGFKKRIKFLELRYQFHYNKTDIWVYPLNGLEVKAQGIKRGLGIDNDVNQLILQGELSCYKELSPLFSYSGLVRGRLAFPDKQIYLLNRAMGFTNEYIRGYEYYVIDGTHYGMLRNSLRAKIIDRVFHQKITRRMPYIPLRVFTKVYSDLGYVNNRYPGNSFLHNTILHGYGIGIDLIISYYAKLRIEYSFNHLGEKGLFLHASKE